MNVITAYLTKSVMNSGGGGYTSNYIKKLKQAVTLGNLQQFIENFYVILTPDGQPGTMNKRTSAVSYYYNPFVQEKNGEGWDSITYPGKYAKGCSAVLSGVYGAAACLRYDSTSYSQIDSLWVSDISTRNVILTYCARPEQIIPDTALVWRDEQYEDESTIRYRTTTRCTIPIFAGSEAAQTHIQRVVRYCNSASDSDLADVESNMESNLYDYEYDPF